MNTHPSLPVLRALAELSPSLEPAGTVEPSLRALTSGDVLRWVIPREFGGLDVSPAELLDGYVALSEVCLTTAFVLTQRNGACQRLGAAVQCPARSDLLPALARGERFATVGISHLTTSRRHLRQPAVAVSAVDEGFRLTGEIPWVTGAPFADDFVTGGSLPDGTQVLVVVEAKSPGVTVKTPVELLALNASQTAAVRVDEVFVPRERVLFGPALDVMKLGTGGGTGSLSTSALAVGTTGRTLALLGDEAARRAELRDVHAALTTERDGLLADLRAAAAGGGLPGSEAAAGSEITGSIHSAESLRQRANSLVTRAAQALLAASKGAGFVRGHPAERSVREAMFFLVWSCPQPVVAAALREFACADGWQ